MHNNKKQPFVIYNDMLRLKLASLQRLCWKFYNVSSNDIHQVSKPPTYIATKWRVFFTNHTLHNTPPPNATTNKLLHIVICDLPGSTTFYCIISWTTLFSKKATEHKTCVLDFSPTFVWNSEIDKKKCILVFM